MTRTPAQLADGDELDVLVLGGGGGGLEAAVFAAAAGLRTAVIERTELVGGTTSYTAGTTWIPVNHKAAEVGADDSVEDATTFLDTAVGERSPREVRASYIGLGDEAVRTIERVSHVAYRPRPIHPDYLSQLPGARLSGRALEPESFDGRLLGDRLAIVREPFPEFTLWDGMHLERDDLPHLFGKEPTEESRRHLLGLLRRYRADLREHGRDTRMTMGNALIGRLLYSLDERHVPIELSSEVVVLNRGCEGYVATIETPRGRLTVHARNVVLASGGFNRHPERRAKLLPGHDIAWCPGAPGHTGSAHDLVEQFGAHYGTTALANAYFAPVSRRRRADGSWAVFPHFVMDRAKPHMLVVDQHGRRYLNEATSYHLFGVAMVKQQHETYGALPSFLVTDRQGMWKYGLGMVHPFARERTLRSAVDEGYLLRGDTLAELAENLGVPAEQLVRTVDRYNAMAASGEDLDFEKGTTDYQRFNGDPDSPTGNPNVAPLDEGPFYAVRLHPGDIGAATGFVTDENAAMLDRSGRPIPGLYAVGNDMQSALGGTYPAPGITLGPALVFSYAAIRDIAGADALAAAGSAMAAV